MSRTKPKLNDKEIYQVIREISALSAGGLVGNGLSSLELMAVVYGLKPTMAEMVNFDQFDQNFIKKLDRINELCRKLSLHFVVSNHKFIINSPRGIFEMVDLADERKGKIALGASKDKKLAMEAEEKQRAHSQVGR